MEEKWDRSDKFGLFSLIYLIINLVAFVLFCIFFPILTGQESMKVHSFDWITFWEGVGASIVASAIITIVANIINYYVNLKKLRKIPEETKQQIQDLLDKRLGYDTDNHNTELSALSSAKTELSHQHKWIHDEITSTKEHIASVSNQLATNSKLEEAYRNNLSDNQRIIIDSVRNLDGFSRELKEVNYENSQLRQEKTRLEKENQKIKAQLRKYEGQNQEHTPHRKSQNHDAPSW